MKRNRRGDQPQPSPSAEDTSLADEGSATVETALAMVLLMLLLMGIVQFALVEHASHIAKAAAANALAQAQTEDGTAADGNGAGAQALAQLGGDVLQHARLTVVRTSDQVTAVVHGQVLSVFPGLHLPVTAHAAGPVERVTAPASAP
ncbi:pilus assembly protein [Streptacidiphilus pinicola]|uniref:Pilus assembly protein n=1 Tax=Streptacidiphilus pinicola TaxID=2219663 RepID=A0A2X0IRJ9_9ACTN|nr:TadE/TadG family type IV pilus assembly protein [Streptacidiphilus pinicola]RAG86213.1 pilus assembly protein [Streptacidiphilus pinicola]